MERHKAKKTGEKSELINVIITNGGQVIDICWQFGYTQKQLDTPNYSSSIIYKEKAGTSHIGGFPIFL